MRKRSLTRGLVLIACLVSAGALAPGAALADGPLALRMQVGGTCVAGHKPTGDPITVKLLRSDGTTRATRTDSTTDFDWKVCFSVPVAGERVKLSTSFAPVRTVRIPVLTAVADRVSNVVTGRGPAGGELSIKYYSCHPGECSPAPSRLTTVNSQGRYHKDLSTGSSRGYRRLGQDRGELPEQPHDSFTRTTFAPYMEIKAPNTIHLSCLPKGTTTLKLSSSGGTLRATRSFTLGKDCGSASGSFKKNGDAVNVHVGDRVTADFASDAQLKWPVMSMTAPLGGHAVTLHCVPHADFMVRVRAASRKLHRHHRFEWRLHRRPDQPLDVPGRRPSRSGVRDQPGRPRSSGQDALRFVPDRDPGRARSASWRIRGRLARRAAPLVRSAACP